MNRVLTPLAVLAGLFAILILSANSSGAAARQGRGYTGAPSAGGGTESNCAQCHNTGNFGEPIVTVTIAETLNGAAVSEYTPGQTYFVTVNVRPEMNTPAAYGYQSLFLADDGTAIRPQAGTLQNPSEGSQITTIGSRLYAEQDAPEASGDFSFEWVAPAVGTGDVTVYTVGNTVNGLSGSQGDNGSTASTIVSLTEGDALPLNLVSFTGQPHKSAVRLEWETSDEEDFSHFLIERQIDNDWEQIGRVNGQNFSQGAYTFTDERPAPGPNVYRLKMTDRDGSYTYSPLVLARAISPGVITVYPNPATNFVRVRGNLSAAARISVLNANGSVLSSHRAVEPVDVRGLLPGLYYLEVQDGGTQYVHKILKR